MPVAPLEAMANGCVPLVSSLDCFRDYIQDGMNGFVFDHRHGDPIQNLATQMTDLLAAFRNKSRAHGGSRSRRCSRICG